MLNRKEQLNSSPKTHYIHEPPSNLRHTAATHCSHICEQRVPRFCQKLAISQQEVSIHVPFRIVALDRETRDALLAEYTLYQSFNADDFTSVMAFRIKILRELLDGADLIIHSDCDAVWLGNPLPLIDRYKSDMVFSQAGVWPPDTYARHCFVL